MDNAQEPVSITRKEESLQLNNKRVRLEGNQFASPSNVCYNVTLPGLLAYIQKNASRINADQNESGQVIVTYDDNTVKLTHGLFARPVDDFRNVIPMIVISGSLKSDPDLEMIKGWNKSMYAPMDLSKIVRANKHLFKTPEEWMSLRTNLQDFVAKVDEVREHRHDDEGGSMKKRFERVLREVPNLRATLKVPLIYGRPSFEMDFEIAFDSAGEVVTAGLRNWDLETRIREEKEKAIETLTSQIGTLLPSTPIMAI